MRRVTRWIPAASVFVVACSAPDIIGIGQFGRPIRLASNVDSPLPQLALTLARVTTACASPFQYRLSVSDMCQSEIRKNSMEIICRIHLACHRILERLDASPHRIGTLCRRALRGAQCRVPGGGEGAKHVYPFPPAVMTTNAKQNRDTPMARIRRRLEGGASRSHRATTRVAAGGSVIQASGRMISRTPSSRSAAPARGAGSPPLRGRHSSPGGGAARWPGRRRYGRAERDGCRS